MIGRVLKINFTESNKLLRKEMEMDPLILESELKIVRYSMKKDKPIGNKCGKFIQLHILICQPGRII
jgi:hypothetical protein